MQGTILNGRYRLEQSIGEGGMAVVFRGWDLLLNREVAVKILREQYAADESFLKRFEREGQIAAGMSHPNIVSVYDVGHDQGLHYIVMEFIRGPNLKELIIRQGPFSVDGAVFIISQVASALDYAHQRGLVHRDIKPQNILVDREGNAKVVDFGIAKGVREPHLTEAGTGMGTVHYVSPEQARGENVGPASDLYSTGVVLFEMLTRQVPFDADTPVGVAMHHVNTGPPPPSSINSDIPPEIDRIAIKALAKHPDNRYPTGSALEIALRHWDDPVFTSRRQQQSANTPPPVAGQPAQPRRGNGQRQPPPPRRRRRRPSGRPPARKGSSDEVGCGTWIIGVVLLIGVLAVALAALQWGPTIFESGPALDAIPTITGPAMIEPTESINPEEEPTVPIDILPTPTMTAPPPPTPTLTATPTQVTAQPVPDLRNGTVSQARIAVAGNWELDVVEEYSESVEAGIIIRQDPAPETSLGLGESITVWVSRGSGIISIPDVRGLTEEEAVEQLEELGFSVEIEEESSTTVDEGMVIRTDPPAEAEANSEVTVVVSLGNVIVVPDVFGEHVIDAQRTLENAGVVVGSVHPQTCERIHRGNPQFDCSQLEDGDVVSAVYGPESEPLDWGQTVEPGTVIRLAYYQASVSP